MRYFLAEKTTVGNISYWYSTVPVCMGTVPLPTNVSIQLF